MRDGMGELWRGLLRNVNDDVVLGWNLQVARQLDAYHQTRMHVGSRQGAMVQSNRALRNRQPQACSPAGTVSGAVDAKERFEDTRQHVLGHARPVVANGDCNLRGLTIERDLNGRALRSVADGISKDVLHRPSKEFLICAYCCCIATLHDQAAASNIGFDGTVG